MLKGDIPEIDLEHPEHSVEEQRAYYEEEKGIIFLDDVWSLWNIRVWANSRESNGMGISINSSIVFRYAERYSMPDIETLERVKHIERGANSE